MSPADKILAEVDGRILELLVNQGKHDAIMNAFIDLDLPIVKALRHAVEYIKKETVGELFKTTDHATFVLREIARELGVDE